jgi:hypothetical protein
MFGNLRKLRIKKQTSGYFKLNVTHPRASVLLTKCSIVNGIGFKAAEAAEPPEEHWF